YLSAIPTLYPPPPISISPAERSAIQPVSPYGDIPPANTTLKEMLAALVISHGALRGFFPYFATVGDYIDDRLLETVHTAEGAGAFDRVSFSNILRRLGEAIKDGHMFVFNFGASTVVGYFPVSIENVANTPVVRRSLAPGVNPGDAIISFDGQPFSDFFATESVRTSAATPGYLFDKVLRELIYMEKATQVGLQALDGSTRIVTVVPASAETYLSVGFAPSLREAGFLSDLGAPELYYINLDGEVLDSESELLSALREAEGASGLVLD